MSRLGCGTEKVRGNAQYLGHSLNPSAGHPRPLGNSCRADLKLSSNPLYGVAALEQVVEDGIAHNHFLSGARSPAQHQTKSLALRSLWQTQAMSEREDKPRTRKPKPTERNPKAIAIGIRVAKARKMKGYSQPQLAAIVGISSGAIGQYEAGIAMPKLGNLQKLAEVLEVSTEWLLTGDEPDELVRAQTHSEQEALRLMRMIPAGDHATALAIWETLSRQKPSNTKK